MNHTSYSNVKYHFMLHTSTRPKHNVHIISKKSLPFDVDTIIIPTSVKKN